MEGDEIPRILIISEGDFPKDVESRTWLDVGLHKIPNISEFDIVILNLLDLNKGKDIDDNPQLNLKKIHNLLWNGSELIIITDGRKLISINPTTRINIYSVISPVEIPIEIESGDTIYVEDETYKEYHRNVEHWKFYLSDECSFRKMPKGFLTTDEVEILEDTGCPFAQVSKVIARNGFNKAISFSIVYGIKKDGSSESHISGPLTILQAPNDTISAQYAIKTLLSNYGIHVKSKAPTWTNDFKVPDEERIEKEIESLETEKKKKESEIESKKGEKEEITRYKKLLFEDGDELRDIVWDTLEEIGFTLNRYDDLKEDGSIQTDNKVAVLEIKGKEKSLATEDVRQLDDWIGDYAQREGKEPIGILIGNHFRLKKPENRGDPFPDDVLRYVNARSTKLSLMTTHQLFELFCMVKTKQIDPKRLREEIIANAGVFDIEKMSDQK
ncbi:MAG: hypothetical protein PHY36_05760 [Methanocellales archaeon]|nr:hypothetical protein [Methanocellales archaeon]